MQEGHCCGLVCSTGKAVQITIGFGFISDVRLEVMLLGTRTIPANDRPVSLALVVDRCGSAKRRPIYGSVKTHRGCETIGLISGETSVTRSLIVEIATRYSSKFHIAM